MRDIFLRSVNTLVWLGESDSDIDEVVLDALRRTELEESLLLSSSLSSPPKTKDNEEATRSTMSQMMFDESSKNSQAILERKGSETNTWSAVIENASRFKTHKKSNVIVDSPTARRSSKTTSEFDVTAAGVVKLMKMS